MAVSGVSFKKIKVQLSSFLAIRMKTGTCSVTGHCSGGVPSSRSSTLKQIRLPKMDRLCAIEGVLLFCLPGRENIIFCSARKFFW